MNGVDMLRFAAEELKGKEMARKVAAELTTPIALLACTVDLVLMVKFLEKQGMLPEGLAHLAQSEALDFCKKAGML